MAQLFSEGVVWTCMKAPHKWKTMCDYVYDEVFHEELLRYSNYNMSDKRTLVV